MQVHDIFLDMLPKIDLHGFDIESARVKTNDFIEEAFIMEYIKVVIIHGIGTGKVKNTVHETLAQNKKVKSYKLDSLNIGCTVVELKSKDDDKK